MEEKKKYLILWHNSEYDVFEGTLDEAKDFATHDHRHQDYGHNGVTIVEYTEELFKAGGAPDEKEKEV